MRGPALVERVFNQPCSVCQNNMSKGRVCKYVVAFNRDRDFYQVPAALADVGKLEGLMTDLYLPDSLVGGWLSRALGLGHRHCGAVSSARVKWSLEALWLQMVALRSAKSARRRSEIFNRIDAALSRKAGSEALRSGAGLLLYRMLACRAHSSFTTRRAITSGGFWKKTFRVTRRWLLRTSGTLRRLP
jgi:hypothetical protein